MNLVRVFGRWAAISVVALGPSACGDDDKPASTADTLEVSDTSESDTAESDTSADVAPDTTPETTEEVTPDVAEVTGPLCDYTEPACSDEQIALLQLSDDKTGGDIKEEGTTAGEFLSHIDATAGGFNGTLGYTYARFTDDGLVAVDLSDEEALESLDWDIAFRRYIARLNSGVSGPSCVEGGRTAPNTTFEGLTAVPGNLTFRAEQYFTAGGCEYVPETSGIGSPLTVLSSYWNYEGCVTMSGNIYVVKLRDGRNVKLQFQSYYTPSVQVACDDTGSAPSPNGAGNIRVRWAFID
jgi:hypothetical protein